MKYNLFNKGFCSFSYFHQCSHINVQNSGKRLKPQNADGRHKRLVGISSLYEKHIVEDCPGSVKPQFT